MENFGTTTRGKDLPVVNPDINDDATELAAGKLNVLGTVDFSTIALPSTPGTAEYNGTFTDNSASGGDITTNAGLTAVSKWAGDTTIVTGKTYSFSIQNGIGFIIQMD